MRVTHIASSRLLAPFVASFTIVETDDESSAKGNPTAKRAS
jgi:hypothetical protein